MGENVKRVTVLVDENDANNLKKLAFKNNTNMSEILRTCIKKTTKREVLVE